ncbi:MAG: hypothetical protein PHX72_01270, partial [Candidatus Shapirobacteria bacterium]|nr:hypothetical protein [Candidatus Shapirobacteria bacterium]
LTAKYATEIARQIGAKIILPIHYIEENGRTPLNQIEPVTKFLKEIGNNPNLEPKLMVTKNDLLIEGEKLVLLENRGK